MKSAEEESHVEGTRTSRLRTWAPIFIVVSLLLVVLAIVASAKRATTAGDSYAVYLPAAECFLDGRYSDGFRQHFHGVTRRPGFALLIAGMGFVSGLEPFSAAMLLGTLGATAIAVLTYAIAGILFDRRVALWAALISVGTPLFLRMAVEPMSDVVSMAINLGVLWLVLARRDLSVRRMAALAILVLVAIQIRAASIHLVGWFLLSLALGYWRGSVGARALAGIAVAFFSYFPFEPLWRQFERTHAKPGGSLLLSLSREVVGDLRPGAHIESLDLVTRVPAYLFHLGTSAPAEVSASLLGPVLSVVAGVGLASFLVRTRPDRWVVLGFYFSYFAPMALFLFEPRYWLPLLPLLATSLAAVVERGMTWFPGHRMRRGVTILIAGFLLGRAGLAGTTALGEARELTRRQEPELALAEFLRRETLPGTELSVSAHWYPMMYHPLGWYVRRDGGPRVEPVYSFSGSRSDLYLFANNRDEATLPSRWIEGRARFLWYAKPDERVLALLQRIDAPAGVATAWTWSGAWVRELTDADPSTGHPVRADGIRLACPPPCRSLDLSLLPGPSTRESRLEVTVLDSKGRVLLERPLILTSGSRATRWRLGPLGVDAAEVRLSSIDVPEPIVLEATLVGN